MHLKGLCVLLLSSFPDEGSCMLPKRRNNNCHFLASANKSLVMSIPSHSRSNQLTKTLQAKATDLNRRLLGASCNGRYFRLLNPLVWTGLSQQSYGAAATVVFSFSGVTTLILKAQLA